MDDRTADLLQRMQEDSPTSPSHYSRFVIEPLDFIEKNNLSYLQGNIIKYILRHDAKNGKEDLLKAQVYLQRMIAAYDS